jgi:hypothetical protein
MKFVIGLGILIGIGVAIYYYSGAQQLRENEILREQAVAYQHDRRLTPKEQKDLDYSLKNFDESNNLIGKTDFDKSVARTLLKTEVDAISARIGGPHPEPSAPKPPPEEAYYIVYVMPRDNLASGERGKPYYATWTSAKIQGLTVTGNKGFDETSGIGDGADFEVKDGPLSASVADSRIQAYKQQGVDVRH